MEDSHPNRNTSYHSDERFQHLHLSTWEHIPQSLKKGFALTSIQIGTHPITMMEGLALTSDPTRTHPSSHSRKALYLHPSRGTHPTTLMEDSYPDRNTSYHSDKRFQHLYLVLREHIPAVTPERLCTYIHPGEHIQPH